MVGGCFLGDCPSGRLLGGRLGGRIAARSAEQRWLQEQRFKLFTGFSEAAETHLGLLSGLTSAAVSVKDERLFLKRFVSTLSGIERLSLLFTQIELIAGSDVADAASEVIKAALTGQVLMGRGFADGDTDPVWYMEETNRVGDATQSFRQAASRELGASARRKPSPQLTDEQMRDSYRHLEDLREGLINRGFPGEGRSRNAPGSEEAKDDP